MRLSSVAIPFSSFARVFIRITLTRSPVPRKSLSLCSGAERNAFFLKNALLARIVEITVHWDAWQEAIGRQNSFISDVFGVVPKNYCEFMTDSFDNQTIAYDDSHSFVVLSTIRDFNIKDIKVTDKWDCWLIQHGPDFVWWKNRFDELTTISLLRSGSELSITLHHVILWLLFYLLLSTCSLKMLS